MGKIGRFDTANFRTVLNEIRRLWEEGSVIILPHARQRMVERNLDELDVQNIFLGGRVTQQIGKRFRVIGKSVEGAKAACVVEIEGDLIIVTVMHVLRR